MKKLTSKILLAILASICFGNESYGEIITLITTEAKNFDSDPIEVKEGEVLKVLHVKKSNLVSTDIKVVIDEVDFVYTVDKASTHRSDRNYSGNEFVFQNPYTNDGGGAAAAVPLFSNLIFQGPLTFSISSANKPSLVTVEVTSNESAAGNGNNVTVIPETADDSTLVLEGSDDMVNWTTETLGDKPKANRKKFYRLRAKKQ